MVTIKDDVKVVRIGNSLRIALPSVFCKALGIAEGDMIHLESTDHQILLEKLEAVRISSSKKRG